MTEPRAILHIGQAKTGTTAIQNAFFGAADELLELGILYPKTARRGSGHHELAPIVTRKLKRPRTKFLDEWKVELAAADPTAILWSTEALSTQAAANRDLGFLEQLFSGCVPAVACILREHGDYLESLTAQLYKSGRTTARPSELLSQFLQRGQGRYSRYLDNFANHVGTGAMHIADYHVAKADVLAWTSTDSGLHRPDALAVLHEHAAQSNERLGHTSTTILRTLAASLERPLTGPLFNGFRHFLATELHDDPKPVFYTPDQIAQVRSFYAAEAADLRERYCPEFGLNAPPTPDYPNRSLEPDRGKVAAIARRLAERQGRTDLESTISSADTLELVSLVFELWKSRQPGGGSD